MKWLKSISQWSTFLVRIIQGFCLLACLSAYLFPWNLTLSTKKTPWMKKEKWITAINGDIDYADECLFSLGLRQWYFVLFVFICLSKACGKSRNNGCQSVFLIAFKEEDSTQRLPLYDMPFLTASWWLSARSASPPSTASVAALGPPDHPHRPPFRGRRREKQAATQPNTKHKSSIAHRTRV